MSWLNQRTLGLACALAAALIAPRTWAEQESSDRGAETKPAAQLEGAQAKIEVARPEEEHRDPLVVVGPTFAMVWRPSESSEILYQPGFSAGAFAMLPLTKWLLIRASFRQERLFVDMSPGALSIEGSPRPLELDQPDLSVLAFSTEVEGIYRPIRRLALRGGLGIAWARAVAPAPQAEDFYLDTERVLTVSTLSLSLGAGYTIIPSWLELGLRVSCGLPLAQNGTMLLPLQAVVDGEIAHIDPLPKMTGLVDASLELGVVF